ncbi:MAG: PD40 domain-containing protein [Candidatus Kapabacteria bacterium]|nr:PD40 domain-containing protein [Ignavibacteriota bacterium]MCW5885004.1 PD40 domain-containing protein [Candidatus Kapabacteria bacterium]
MLLNLILFSQSLIAQNGSVRWSEPSNLTILNSSSDDFAPHFDKFRYLLYFNSDREGKSYFYSARLNDASGFADMRIMKSEINKSGKNQSYISVPNSGEAYYSSYRQSDKQSYLNIYKTVYQKNSWTGAFVVDSLKHDSFCSHVTVSPDGSLMVFSSTRSGNIDDIDLWMSFRNESGFWSAPVALDELNSPGNEITPYLHTTDTLYFSSDGYEGPGGFDIYYTTRIGGRWERPRPVTDLNTEFNESDFTLLPDERAIFASDRPGGFGGLDLYISSKLERHVKNITNHISDISIKTQVSNIIAEKQSKVRKFPAFHFFAAQSFELAVNTSQNEIDSLIFAYPEIITGFLRDNPDEKMIIDSSEYNNVVSSFFESRGISQERILFQKSLSAKDLIKIKLLSGEPLPILELSRNTYSYKPPVLEISIDSRKQISEGQHRINFRTGQSKHNIPIESNTLPLRDIISLDEYENEVYNSDSVIINYQITNNNETLAYAERVLFVSRQQFREPELSSDKSGNFEEFIFILPNNIFFESDYFSPNYLNLILESMILSNKVIIEYFNPAMKSQAEKVKELLISSGQIKKNIITVQQIDYYENKVFSHNIAPMIIRVKVYKLL